MTGFSGVLTAAAVTEESGLLGDGEEAGGSFGEVPESDFLGNGDEARGNFGEVPAITLLVVEVPVNDFIGGPETTFCEPGIGLGELDGPATPFTLFFLNDSLELARRLLGGEEELTFADSTDDRCSFASAFRVVGGVPLPVVLGCEGAVVVFFVGRVSDFLVVDGEGEGGGRGLIFNELLVLTVPTVELLLCFGLLFVAFADLSVAVVDCCFEFIALFGGEGRGLLGLCVFDVLPLFASKRAFSLLISEAMLSTTHLVTIITNSCVLALSDSLED